MSASVLVEVSDAMVGVYTSGLRRPPTSARTYWCGPDAIACFLENTFTPAERSLAKLGGHRGLRDKRSLMQYATIAEFCEPVERIVARTVRSFQSSTDTHVDGLAVETFLFYPRGARGPVA